MGLVCLTTTDNEQVWVNTTQIVTMTRLSNATAVELAGRPKLLKVQETPEKVAQLAKD